MRRDCPNTLLYTDLFLQFPLRGLLRGLSGIYPARRSLQQVLAYRVPVLPNEQRPARLIEGQHDHCVGVFDHLTGRPLSVG